MWWESHDHLDVRDNTLWFAGSPVSDAADEHGTPAYLYDTDKIAQQYASLTSAIEDSELPHTEIKYAIKANNHPAVVETLLECGAGIDATSPNEVTVARDLGCDERDIVFTGTSLSDADLGTVAESSVLVNFDSVSALQRFDAPQGRSVGLRINSGVGLGRSKKTSTGGTVSAESAASAATDEDGTAAGGSEPGDRAETRTDEQSDDSHSDDAGIPVKFGIPHGDEESLATAFRIIEDRGYDLDCIHHHVGSGWLDDQAFAPGENYLTALERTLSVAEAAEARGHDVGVLDLGGGFGVPHTEDEDPLDLRRLFDAVARQINDSSVEFERVFLEPGTYLVSDAGVFITRVSTVEEKGRYTFVGVNSGLNSFNSYAHYGYHHEVVNTSTVTTESQRIESVVIAGNNCETGDLFTDERTLPTRVAEGDLLALLNAGAYGAVFTSEFNLREPAAEVIVR
jgi:diaminopimelate decarboxylase